MLVERIDEDLKQAVKAKDAVKTSTLRMLKSAIDYERIAKKKESLKDDEIVEVVARQVKQHKDPIEGYEKGGRAELVEKEKAELAILETYMPEQLSEEELRELVRKKIEELGAGSPKEMGKIMGALMPEVKGKADGKTVSRLVREELQPPQEEEKDE